ncbi:Bacterial regulatory protein, arsR family [uncultured archaeon]|nr:Bacterial regulatory protein, arsR family [uncultured archaeon]
MFGKERRKKYFIAKPFEEREQLTQNTMCITKELFRKRLTVKALCKIAKVSPTTMREHLAALEKSGLIYKKTTNYHGNLWAKVS